MDIAKKSKLKNKKYKVDNYKTVYAFFKKWKRYTEFFK